MFGTHDFLLFVVAGLLLNVTPGPDMLYIMSCSTTQGWRSGAAAVFGISAGCLVHVAAAALGLSALLTASATAFTVVKICGAAYLIYVGMSLAFSKRPEKTAGPTDVPGQIRKVFLRGFWTNVLNPKVALFFLAFVPQFIDTAAAQKAIPFLFLGAVFIFNSTLWNLLVAWSTAQASGKLRNSEAVTWMNRCIGGLFVLLGIRLVFSSR
ncbi:MAG TPA: LysE family translocator [Steroidobacter sp.]|uniref:LysE family translocator n=1 Tax=Steroidobacter sp. TaxID=1978227 RepID=UPI002ED7B967